MKRIMSADDGRKLGIVGGAILPHAPQFLSLPKTEDHEQVARWRGAMQKGGEDFARFIWEMAGGKPIENSGERPTKSALSEDISKTLRKRGFKFVGPVIVYAWMQAVGIVNDHSDDCFRREAVRSLAKRLAG